MKETEHIWMDGKIVKWGDAKVHILTHAIHYGSGVFEGIRFYKTPKGSAVFRLREHIDRLYNSAHILLMKISHDKEEFIKACVEMSRMTNLQEGYIRPIVYRGYGVVGVNPMNAPVNCSIIVWPWGEYLGEDATKHGVRTKISSFTRLHPNILMTKAKATGHYLNSILATQEAKMLGFEEAILLDPDGYVAEGAGENIFIIKNKIIKTPPPESILNGITRDTVIRLVKEMGYEVIENLISRDELYVADEAFFTGTAAEITPIREVDHRVIGTGTKGEITSRLQEKYFKLVRGGDLKYENWLTYL